ncbi:MAG: hypothetical protein GY714_29650 [Desulfobacterales bacterium]|nr:hypothetical protein [Desulfobacterales bacterium]
MSRTMLSVGKLNVFSCKENSMNIIPKLFLLKTPVFFVDASLLLFAPGKQLGEIFSPCARLEEAPPAISLEMDRLGPPMTNF